MDPHDEEQPLLQNQTDGEKDCVDCCSTEVWRRETICMVTLGRLIIERKRKITHAL